MQRDPHTHRCLPSTQDLMRRTMLLQEFRHTLAALQQVLGELAARPAAAGASVFSPPAASAVSATVRSSLQVGEAMLLFLVIVAVLPVAAVLLRWHLRL